MKNGFLASYYLGNDACDLLDDNVSSITFELFYANHELIISKFCNLVDMVRHVMFFHLCEFFSSV
jgi:hypothetical protein